MGNSDFPVLKGQNNLAQGIALGLKTEKRIVRDKMVAKERFSFRTKEIINISRQKNAFLFHPKEGFCLEKNVLADGFMCIHRTQGDALGYYILAFQATKK